MIFNFLIFNFYCTFFLLQIQQYDLIFPFFFGSLIFHLIRHLPHTHIHKVNVPGLMMKKKNASLNRKASLKHYNNNPQDISLEFGYTRSKI